ncbi:hypothetical protein HPP92_009865 [Vanilla planifolia]|uniref:Uncharacterized protein n=1 Tax=Vanilla planifolia TaxID=51239 RepID=A0A835R7Q7_VANPL|nr:hypothetical protein HPP92_010068 [Vanilla planifolia]KAG0487770.1 hypothetical protein HPP92_009865 [Vanilla planifolia]
MEVRASDSAFSYEDFLLYAVLHPSEMLIAMSVVAETETTSAHHTIHEKNAGRAKTFKVTPSRFLVVRLEQEGSSYDFQ